MGFESSPDEGPDDYGGNEIGRFTYGFGEPGGDEFQIDFVPTQDGLLHVEVRDSSDEAAVTRVTLGPSGLPVEPGDAEPDSSMFDFRVSFGEGYILPDAAEQQAAAGMQSRLHRALFELGGEPVVDTDMGVVQTVVHGDDLIVATGVAVLPDSPFRNDWGAGQVYIGERRQDGIGTSTEYCLDGVTGKSVRRWDSSGPNNATLRHELHDVNRLAMARSEGEDAFARTYHEIKEERRAALDRHAAAEAGTNFLPVGADEMQSVVEFLDEQLGYNGELLRRVRVNPDSNT